MPYRVADPPPPFVSVEPDPFPAASAEAMKELERRRRARVMFCARRLVAVTRQADVAREAFPESRELQRRCADAVLRAFASLGEAVDALDGKKDGG